MRRVHECLRRTIVLVILSTLSSITVDPVEAATGRALPLTPADFHTLATPDAIERMPFEVINGNPQAVHLRFSEPPLQRDIRIEDGKTYSLVRLPGEGSTIIPGEPELPRVTRLVMVSNTGEVGLEVVRQSFSVVDAGGEIPPYRGLDDDPVPPLGPVASVYERDAWYPPAVAEISAPATLRDVRFVAVTVYPVQVNPVTGQLRIYDDIELLVSNLGGTGENEIHITPQSVTPDFKKLYSVFGNFRGSHLDDLPVVPGKFIAICDSTTSIVNEVQRLVNWKRQRGIDATLARLQVEVGGTSSSAIRTYIGNQYAASNGQLEHVCLVGDATSGTPTTWYTATEGSQLDNYYGTLPNNAGPNPDPVPDIAVGRLSCRQLVQLSFIINKIVGYEASPDTTDTGWFTRGYCVAHTGHAASNTSTKRYTQQLMLLSGLSPVYFNSYAYAINLDTLNAHLTQGISVFNHRMSWISGEMNEGDLANCPVTPRLPFVMTITCGTGSFAGTGATLSEEWLVPSESPSVDEPRGAIGAVGLSGAGTHTRFNNIVDAGVMYGLYALGIETQGVAVIAGKIELYRNYIAAYPSNVASFCYWMNLMGDPSTPVWRNRPYRHVLSKPASVPVQTNNVTIGVTRAGNPVEGALVSLVKGSETFVRGYTDGSGTVNLPVNLPTTGYLKVTVTKDDLYPIQDSITVVTAAASLSHYSVTVDDDNSGGTSGDGNGVLNPGETVDLSVRLQNTGTSQTVTGISGTLSCTTPGITVTAATRSYPDIPVGSNAAPTAPFRIQVGAVLDSVPAVFHLNTTSSAGSQDIRFELIPRAANVAFVSRTVYDANNRLDPGESVDMAVTFRNSGARSLSAATGILRSLDSHVTVTDSIGTFGAVGIGSTAANSTDRFHAIADVWTAAGYRARMLLIITDTNGFRDSTEFVDTLGTRTTTSPTGPDGYGYYAYDDTETQPAGASCVPDWIEIWNQGGTSLNFNDNAQNADTSATVMLPFPFQFYGVVFDRVTICSNGWLAFGSYPMNDFRNYRIPSPLGPPYQVAAYWDDLRVNGPDSNVYYRYDTGAHWFIVEWRARTLWTNIRQFFQIILYDPAHYPSPTGDGKIKIQYQLVTPDANQDPYPEDDNPWATVGIQNGSHSDGLEYCYWNAYAPGAATLANNRAIMFTTDVSGYIPTSLVLVSPTGGETWYQHTNATVTWIGGQTGDNIRIELSRNGTGGPWEVLAASTPNDRSESFTISGPPSTTCRIRITSLSDPGQTDMSDADFTISALRVLSPNGGEIWVADSTAIVTWMGGDPAANVKILLYRSGLAGPYQTITASTVNDGSHPFTVTLPTSSTCRVQVTSLGDPTDSDVSDGDFAIQAVQTILSENFESGAPGWTHNTPGGTWVDQWHLSTERAFSGTMSFKCGDTGTGTYAIYCDSRLLSPVISNLPANARLRFQHQIQSETSPLYADSCYDGGVLEISVNGGTFTQIPPVGGYPQAFRYLSGSGNPATGPMLGQPCWADSTPPVWREAQVDLSAYAGQNIQLRFRFGSDRGKNFEGWYIDDVLITAPGSVPWTPLQPVAVTLRRSGNDLILQWNDDDNLFYRIYWSLNASGPYQTESGWWTDGNEFTIPGGFGDVRKFYQVVGWDGQ